MARIPEHIIDEILNTARIEEVIGEFVQLKRAGSSMKGMSPFVDEKTPSFMVSPAKQIFKCFSTGKGGNVVNFIMEHEHFSYPEALRWLADKYNIELPKEREMTPEEQQALTERESLNIINEFARDVFVKNLHETDEGKAIGLSYFLERGFRKDIIEKFQLGYCLSQGKSFTDTALEKQFKLEYLEKVGLSRTKDGRHFDFFRGRVMFPIHGVSGKVIGFGGRTLKTDKKIAKYFNSPESPVYNKSAILYGLFFAKNNMIKYDNCFLVEGYTDVIAMHQAGIENVVASSGTALTKDQIKLIKRYTNNITILYDGDAAGIKASFRGIDLILAEGMNVKVVLFPDGDDPDSYSKKVSSEELIKYIEDSKKDFVAFKTDVLLDTEGSDPIKRAGLIKDIVESISLIPDSITRSVYIKDAASRFEMDEQTLLNELNKIRRKELGKENNVQQIQEVVPTPKIPVINQPQEASKGKQLFYDQEFDVIRILMKYGTRAITTKQPNELGELEEVEVSVIELICYELSLDELKFNYELFNEVFEEFDNGLKESILYKSSHFLRHQNPEIAKLVAEIETSPYELSLAWFNEHKIDTNEEVHKLDQAVMGTLYSFKLSRIQQRINEIRDELSIGEELGSEKIMDLLSEQMALEKVKFAFTNKLGRIIV